jgi:hypothetical protein
MWRVVTILLILWLLGLLGGYTMGGILHILLVSAIVLGLVNLTRARQI